MPQLPGIVGLSPYNLLLGKRWCSPAGKTWQFFRVLSWVYPRHAIEWASNASVCCLSVCLASATLCTLVM